MMRRICLSAACAAAVLPRMVMAETITADVVVYGSTPAGITAAVQAKRMGRSVVLISQRRRIGGMTTGGLGQVDIGNKSAYSGLALQFFRDVKAHYDRPGSWTRQAKESYKPEVWDTKSPATGYEDTMWTFEPHVAEAILEKWIADAGVTLVRGEWLDRDAGGVVKEGGKIVSIRTLNASWQQTGNIYAGKIFLDCSYEGDLMAAVGVSYVVGRESNSTYDETLNGYQPNQPGHELVAGIDPYVTKGDATSGLLPGIRAHATVENRETGSGDSFVQSYNYRLCLTTTDQDNCIPFTAPDGYDASRYELLFRAIDAGDDMKHKNECPMPNKKTDTNNDGGVSTDYIGMNWEYPEATYARRAEIALDHLRYVQGLFYTLANDSRVPADTRALYSDHGVCADEFTDSPYGAGWSDELYIRESRRMVGAYVMTEKNIRGTAVAPKEIARGSYGIDSHAVQRYVGVDGYVHNEGNIQWQKNLEEGKTYPIGYDAVTPKKQECENLLVTFCLSASHCAYGSIRMEPVLFELGQACGAAAAIAVENDCAVQDVPYTALRVRKYDTQPPQDPSLRITGVEIDADGRPTQFHVDVVVNGQERMLALVAAYGLTDGGDDPKDWSATATVGSVTSAVSRLDVTAPAGYGTSWKHLRFFLVEHIGFTICQALTGDGTAYVDTKRKGVTGDGYEITYKVTGNPNAYVMGSRKSAGENNVAVLACITKTGAYEAYLDYADYSDSRLTATGAKNGSWYRAKLTKDKRSLDNLDTGVTYGPDTRTSSDTFETPDNIYLFNFSGTPPGGYFIMTGSIREYIVTTDGGAATNQHFVAAQKTDGTAGFYDRISGGFFENAAGEGSFTVLNPTDEFFLDLDEAGVVAESGLFPSGPVADVDLTDASVSLDPLYSPVLSYGARFLDPDTLPETAELLLAWGENGILSNTNFLENIATSGAAADSRTYSGVKLTPGRHLTVALVAQVGGTVAGTSGTKEVSTIDLEDRRILKAKVNRSAERVATSVTLSILPSETVTKHLVVAYGCRDCGKDRDAWDHVELLGALPPSATEYEWIVPTETAKARAVRFFLLDDDDVPPVIQLYEGIQGDGTAYVDTKRKGVTGDGYEITYKVTGNPNAYVMGSRKSAGENNVAVLACTTITGAYEAYLDYADYKDSRLTATGAKNGSWYRAKLTKDKRSLDNLDTGVTYGPDTRTSSDTFETPDNIYLFNFSGTPPGGYFIMTGSIREYIVTTGGGTVTNQHFVAAKLSDGTKVGFYDIANPDPATAWHENAAESGSLSVYGEQIGTYGEQELNLTDNSISCSLALGLIIFFQ